MQGGGAVAPAASSASSRAAEGFVQVGGPAGDVWYRQGGVGAASSFAPSMPPTSRNDLTGGSGAGISGFIFDNGGSFAGADDDLNPPTVPAKKQGGGGGKGGGGWRKGVGRKKKGGGRRKKGGGGKKRNYKGGKGGGKKKKTSNSTWSAWSGREAGIGAYHGGGANDTRLAGVGGAEMKF